MSPCTRESNTLTSPRKSGEPALLSKSADNTDRVEESSGENKMCWNGFTKQFILPNIQFCMQFVHKLLACRILTLIFESIKRLCTRGENEQKLWRFTHVFMILWSSVDTKYLVQASTKPAPKHTCQVHVQAEESYLPAFLSPMSPCSAVDRGWRRKCIQDRCTHVP